MKLDAIQPWAGRNLSRPRFYRCKISVADRNKYSAAKVVV